MKKLTAGIFMALIGLCASNSADAAVASSEWVAQQLATKQGELTFDTTPTADSKNPVTSGGVASALGTKVDLAVYNQHINDQQARDEAQDTAIDALVGTDGQGGSFATLTADVEMLKSDASVTGSVAQKISTAISDLKLGETYATVAALAETDADVLANATAIADLEESKQDVLTGSDAIEIKENVVSIITGAITNAMLAENSVGTAQLVDGAVTGDKIEDGAVTNDKIDSVEQGKVTGLADALADKISEPTQDCENPGAKCVLVYGTISEGVNGYAWEVIERGTAEQLLCGAAIMSGGIFGLAKWV